MTAPPISKGIPDVPTRVFEKFLEDLNEAGVPADMVARLRKTLLEDKKYTEHALKEAVLAEEPLP